MKIKTFFLALFLSLSASVSFAGWFSGIGPQSSTTITGQWRLDNVSTMTVSYLNPARVVLQQSSNSATISLASNTAITQSVFDKAFNVITSTGGPITLSAIPTIATSTALTGEMYWIQSATDTVTFQDNGTLAGSALELGANTRDLGVGDVLILLYRKGKWWEIGFFNN